MRRVGYLVFIGILLLTACDKKQSEDQSQSTLPSQRAPYITPTFSGPVALTLWHPYQGANADALQSAANKFTTANPTLTVSLEYHAPENLLTDYEQALRQGAGPDILVTQPEWVGGLVKNRLILPLDTSLIDYLSSQLDASVFQSLDYQGLYWASPLSADLLMMYSKIADMTLEPRAIDDLLIVAGEKGVIFPADPMNLVGLYQAPTGSIFNSDGHPSLDEPTLMTFATLLQSLAASGRVTFSDDPSTFINGTASAMIAPASLYPALVTALGDQLRVSLLPEITAGVLWRPVLDLNLLTISANAPDESVRAASLLMAYLISPEAQGQLAEQGDFMPLMNVTSTTDAMTRLYIQELRNAQSTTLDPDVYQTFLPSFADFLFQVRQPQADLPALIQRWVTQ
ncbi:MAG: extracellular solute-binding protein [Chloroflexi bacterium]|nr:extracellular solute-binding protein [Chloroflexota bacterium]